jgi:hypothetical protein
MLFDYEVTVTSGPNVDVFILNTQNFAAYDNTNEFQYIASGSLLDTSGGSKAVFLPGMQDGNLGTYQFVVDNSNMGVAAPPNDDATATVEVSAEIRGKGTATPGIGGGGDTTQTAADTPTATYPSVSEHAELDAMGRELHAEGFDIKTLTLDRNAVQLEYVVPTMEDHGGEMGTVAGIYARQVVDAGLSTKRVSVRVYDPEGEPLGTYYITSTLAQQYLDDEITKEEFAQEVIDTLAVMEQ